MARPTSTHPTDNADDAFDDAPTRPSKSQLKRDMQALQGVGEALVGLSKEQLQRIAMPDVLRTAVLQAQRITKHEARRRQMQYIGKLMRDADATPIREALDVINGVSAAEVARQHRLEQWRTRLLADEDVLNELLALYPNLDIQQLRQLRRNALREREQNKPPRAFREMFKVLKELDSSTKSNEPAPADDDDLSDET